MRTVTKTNVIKLDIPEERLEDVHETFRQYHMALSMAVDKAWEDEKKTTSRNRLHHQIYYDIREETDLPSNLVCSAEGRVARAVKLCVKNWSEGKKASKPSFAHYGSIQLDPRTLTAKNRSCTFSTVNDRVKAQYRIGDYQKEILDDPNYEFKSATLTYKDGEFFLHLTVEKPVEVSNPETVMGVDLGLNTLAVTSTGKFFSGNILADRRRQYRKTKRGLQVKGTRSTYRTLSDLDNRENRFSDDVLHKISRDIVDEAVHRDADVIAFEDLTGIRERVGRWTTDQRRRLSTWTYRRLKNFVTYKALEAGIDVKSFGPQYTSQKCSKCGHTSRDNRSGNSFCCQNCGYRVHADYNASKNIGLKAMQGKSLSMVGPPCQLALKSGVLNPSSAEAYKAA